MTSKYKTNFPFSYAELLVCGLTLLVWGALALFTFQVRQNFHSRLQNERRSQLETEAQILADGLVDWHQQHLQLSERALEQPRDSQSLVRLNPSIEQIRRYSSSGQRLSSPSQSPSSAMPPAIQSLRQRLGSKPYVYGPVRLNDSQHAVIDLARPAPQQDLLVLELSLSTVLEKLMRYSQHSARQAYLLNARGALQSFLPDAELLQAHGLVSSSLPLGFSIVDPGVDLRTPQPLPPGERSLTALARLIPDLTPQKPSVSLLSPYRDYRGIEVVGTALWLEPLNLALILELNRAGAYSGLQTFGWWLTIFSLLAGLMVSIFNLGLALYLRKSARDKAILQHEYQRFKALFDHAQDAIFILTEKECVACNPSALAMFQAQPEDFKKRPPHLFSPPTQPNGKASLDYAHEIIHDVLQGNSAQFAWRHLRNDGCAFDSEVYLSAQQINRERYILAVIRDLSAQKELEQAQRQNQLRAEAIHQSKSRFLQNISHQLRTPLNAISGAVQIIKSGTSMSPADLNRWVGQIEKAVAQLNRQSQTILELARLDAQDVHLQRENFRLSTLVRELKETFAPQAQKKGLSFDVQLAPHLPDQMYTDRLKLSSVLAELLDNAIRFTSEGGVVLRLSQPPETKQLSFEVEDTGAGIADLDAVFETLNQQGLGAETGAGLGLGLKMSAEYVALLGGQLELAHPPGKGSRFYFSLPLQTTSEALEPAETEALEPAETEANTETSELSPLAHVEPAQMQALLQELELGEHEAFCVRLETLDIPKTSADHLHNLLNTFEYEALAQLLKTALANAEEAHKS